MTWIQTFTGKPFDLMAPDPAAVCLEDIAHALASTCRFSGHTRVPYSVACHSMHVANLVPPEHRLQALLHDAHEAYIGDVSTPMKMMLGDQFRAVERQVWLAVAKAFDIDPELHPSVKHADRVMLMTERRDLLKPCDRKWAPEYEAIEPGKFELVVLDHHFGLLDEVMFRQKVNEELRRRAGLVVWEFNA